MWHVEVTDTFGGGANYCWVDRYEIELPENATDRSVVIAAKKAAGWTGMRCRTDNRGDEFELRPVNGDCVVMFITWAE